LKDTSKYETVLHAVKEALQNDDLGLTPKRTANSAAAASVLAGCILATLATDDKERHDYIKSFNLRGKKSIKTLFDLNIVSQEHLTLIDVKKDKVASSPKKKRSGKASIGSPAKKRRMTKTQSQAKSRAFSTGAKNTPANDARNAPANDARDASEGRGSDMKVFASNDPEDHGHDLTRWLARMTSVSLACMHLVCLCLFLRPPTSHIRAYISVGV